MPFSFGLPKMREPAKLGVLRRATKTILSLRNTHYEERLSHLNLLSLGKRRLRGKLIVCFKILNNFTNVNTTNLFEIDDSMWTRNSGAKLKCRQVHSDCTGTDYHHQWCNVTRLHHLRTILTTTSSTSMFTRSVSTWWWPHNNCHVGLGQTT